MKRIGRWLAMGGVMVAVSACALPRASEIQPARTHIQQLKFDEPENGRIEATAQIDINNASRVDTKIKEIRLNLYRGTTRLGTALWDDDHSIRPGHTAKLKLEFKDMSVPALEAALGRQLVTDGAETFRIDGTIVYETADGPLSHPVAPFQIMTILGPRGSKMQ